MKKIKTVVFAIIALALLAFPVYYFVSKAKQNEKNYSLESPITRNIKNFILSSGTIIPEREVEIKSRVAGVLEEIYVKNGDSVDKNQIIAKVKIIAEIASLANAEADVKLARVSFENQEQNYKRDKEAFDKHLITLAQFQTTEANYETAKENLNKSLRNYDIIKSGGDKKTQSNTLIRSTISGTVTQLPTKVGASIIQSNNFNDGTTIAKIADIETLIFDGNVKEYEVSDLRIGMPVSIKASISDEENAGELTEIATSGTDQSGTIVFNIKSKLKESEHKRTGFSAIAKIVTKEKDSVLCVNEKWVTFENDSSFVFVQINEESDEKRFIKLGMSDGIYSEVLSNLTKEDKIRVYDR